MKFSIAREALLKPLQLVIGAVEKRQTMAILSHVLLSINTHLLTIVGTDLEIELQATATLAEPSDTGKITVDARKLIDICRSLPDDAILTFTVQSNQAVLTSGKGRFVLATLPAEEFPVLEDLPAELEFVLQQKDLAYLLNTVGFSMANQDVRYYLNGMLFSFAQDTIRAVATDGHRLASTFIKHSTEFNEKQIILPRKGVTELTRLVDSQSDSSVSVSVSPNHIRVISDDVVFTSKLIDGRFPNYQQVIPKGGDKVMLIDRDLLKSTLNRVSILSNEKSRGIYCRFSENSLCITANNPEQEEAEEDISVDYTGDDFEVCLNAGYLVDMLSHLPAGDVRFVFSSPETSILVESEMDQNSVYVVMPMRI